MVGSSIEEARRRRVQERSRWLAIIPAKSREATAIRAVTEAELPDIIYGTILLRALRACAKPNHVPYKTYGAKAEWMTISER
jgi:hypothetical protein